jgi:hypothetical protein
MNRDKDKKEAEKKRNKYNKQVMRITSYGNLKKNLQKMY